MVATSPWLCLIPLWIIRSFLYWPSEDLMAGSVFLTAHTRAGQSHLNLPVAEDTKVIICCTFLPGMYMRSPRLAHPDPSLTDNPSTCLFLPSSLDSHR
jgi:hypothetical protein